MRCLLLALIIVVVLYEQQTFERANRDMNFNDCVNNYWLHFIFVSCAITHLAFLQVALPLQYSLRSHWPPMSRHLAYCMHSVMGILGHIFFWVCGLHGAILSKKSHVGAAANLCGGSSDLWQVPKMHVRKWGWFLCMNANVVCLGWDVG